MNNLFILVEANLFCLLTVVFLFIFKMKNFNAVSSKQKFMHLLLAIGIVLSVSANICIKNLCLALCGCCYAAVTYFLCRYDFETEEYKPKKLTKSAFLLISAVVGGLAFYSLNYGINIITYALTFAVIVVFAVEQFNKIRVDNLTKLYNRYGMDIELKEQLARYKRENTDSFYIIACDLDKFKQINDTWGHLEGDRALVLVAGVLSKVSKKFNANVFRIGGDEFVIITDKSEKGLAQDITKAIENELDNLVFRDDFNIQMSIGTALYDGKTSINELLNNADKKLYEAKKR